MNESFLQYIWQSQYFDKKDLLTTEGEKVEIFRQGFLNTDSGPDFSNGKVKIGVIEWAGNIEIHIKSSEWNQHDHDKDNAYENVILHVVWQDDKPVMRRDGSRVPTIEIKERVDKSLINQYSKLIGSSFEVPCGKLLPGVSELIRMSMLDKVLVQRLEFKSQFIRELLKRNNNDWEEACYQLLAKNFGFKVNSEPFLQLAQNLPYRILLKHADHPLQVEALLYGVAGFLEGGIHNDPYFTSLQKEFKILSAKYQLEGKKLNPMQWKFLRLRPANFPTVRIAQFSAVLVSAKNIFSKIIDAKNYAGLNRLFEVSQSPYWGKHYRFGVKSKSEVSSMGKSSSDILIINSVAPLMVAYGLEKDIQEYIDRAQQILQQMPAESNKITRNWDHLNWKVKSAFDSQGLIELYNNYCQCKNCLNCSIGASVLRPTALL